MSTGESFLDGESELLEFGAVEQQQILGGLHADKGSHHLVHLVLALSGNGSTSRMVHSLPYRQY